MTSLQENSTGSGGSHGGGAAAISGFGFQALVGASFVSSMLGGSRLDERLKLGPSSAVNVRFETEAPVDDILIATSGRWFCCYPGQDQRPFGEKFGESLRTGSFAICSSLVGV